MSKYANEPTKKQIDQGAERVIPCDSGAGSKWPMGPDASEDGIKGDADQDGK